MGTGFHQVAQIGPFYSAQTAQIKVPNVIQKSKKTKVTAVDSSANSHAVYNVEVDESTGRGRFAFFVQDKATAKTFVKFGAPLVCNPVIKNQVSKTSENSAEPFEGSAESVGNNSSEH